MNSQTLQGQSDRIIREVECRQLTGICRTTRYMMEKEGEFPARRKLGGRAVGWLLSEVSDWQRSRSKAA
ncbi:TPA: AlpA family phage regulatory protein [Klebsiella pneumoniae]|uniref:helix-turn-helix transcriptional regulator n=1 Tax=Klebsiella TaxID=570 RepID=UPI0008FB19EA|nr:MULTISPECIES: AlpA family phage regulatory protein [Klebsiella]NCB58688.1 AlpA family phage regulatory protein [Gammaproteobacteria bacterium]APP20784.1 DNA-binding protein [Klebsiella pneumoniae]EKZ9860035.1 AlpA family phage regulatory protein [Klebsiella pneumoniae]ELT9747531.1 AlpA family phage regulatory protein [Klebsiella michiganensis]MBZ1682523.1 AlpA family phage regulatory protein [Klebsiella pneumoniae]